MSDERFTGHTIYAGGLKRNEYFQFYENGMRISEKEVLKTLNSQSGAILGYDKLVSDLRKENEQLRQQLLICQQSKNNDGQFQVWEVPPIPQGTRITFSTTEKSGKNE